MNGSECCLSDPIYWLFRCLLAVHVYPAHPLDPERPPDSRPEPLIPRIASGANYWAVHPPSIGNDAPVMFEAAGEQRKSAMAAMSSTEVKDREGSFS